MDIKIGLNNNPREIVFHPGEDRDAVVAALRDGLAQGEGFIELTDAKGQIYFINAQEVAYVEVGSADRPAVGFGGA